MDPSGVLARSRQCSRPGCAAPAGATFTYQYARSQVWLDEQHALAGTPRVDLFSANPPIDRGPTLAPTITKQGPTGSWVFKIPSGAQLGALVALHGTQKPLAWRLSPHAGKGDTWPNVTKDLFGELDRGTRATSQVLDAGDRHEGSEVGGEGGIRTHVPLTGQDAFEAPPLRPLRYLSARTVAG